jgi:uncharacterized protein YkwD
MPSPRFGRTLVITLAGAALLAGPGGADAEAARPLLPPLATCPDQERSDTGPRTQERAMRCLVNAVRKRAGIRPLRTTRRLVRAARLKNAAMMRCASFSHEPCGEAFTHEFHAAGYRGRSMGENLAWGSGSWGTPRGIMRAWLASPGHRRNLLRRDWREQGLAVSAHVRFQGYGDVMLWTSHFGRP